MSATDKISPGYNIIQRTGYTRRCLRVCVGVTCLCVCVLHITVMKQL